jgi:hypothetical protein
MPMTYDIVYILNKEVNLLLDELLFYIPVFIYERGSF